MIEDSQCIGGNGIEVEIDESKFGKRKYYRGHRVEDQWVFGGREVWQDKGFHDSCQEQKTMYSAAFNKEVDKTWVDNPQWLLESLSQTF